MGVQYIGDSNPDGSCFGRTSSEPIAFYGATPAAKTALAETVETTLAISTTTTKWGFSTSTQANAIVASLVEIKARLQALGLG